MDILKYPVFLLYNKDPKISIKFLDIYTKSKMQLKRSKLIGITSTKDKKSRAAFIKRQPGYLLRPVAFQGNLY